MMVFLILKMLARVFYRSVSMMNASGVLSGIEGDLTRYPDPVVKMF